MKDNEIESKIINAFNHAAPDVFDDILTRIEGSSAIKLDSSDVPGHWDKCKKEKVNILKAAGSAVETPADSDETERIVTFTSKKDNAQTQKKENKKRKHRLLSTVLVAIAAASAIFIPLGISSYNAQNSVASVISIDVNPSIEINVNKERRVMSVIPMNTDAEAIVGNMDFSGTDLNVTINALLGSMISKGYLSEIANSILISVDNADQQEAEALQKLLMDEIDKILKSDTFNGAIIGQTIKEDEELRALAEQYGITISKTQLIKEIISQNSKLKFEDLVSLPINDLNLLKKNDTEGVTSIGNASDCSYVGIDAATMTALENAGFEKNNVTGLSAAMDYEDGSLVYEVDFESGGKKYEYEIDAVTGKILKGEQDR